MGFGTRQPTSNEPLAQQKENPWLGENDCVDAFALKLNGMIKKCRGECGREINVRYLDTNQCCPDCR